MHEVASGPGKLRTLFTIFRSMLVISAFTVGGGFVIVTLMKRKFVDQLHWLSEAEMLDLSALAQAAPGAIAVNAAILIGRRAAGLPGMLVAVLATILPPLVLLSLASCFYALFADNPYVAATLKGMQAGVAAAIVDVVAHLGGHVVRERNLLSLAVMAAAFVLSFFLHVNVVLIVLGAAAVGALRALWLHRKGGAR